MFKNAVAAITAIPFNAAGLLPAFQALNPNGLEQPCFLLRIINDSDTPILVSYDGVNPADHVRADSDLQIDLRKDTNDNECFRKGTIVYVGATAPGIGAITLVGYYRPLGAV